MVGPVPASPAHPWQQEAPPPPLPSWAWSAAQFATDTQSGRRTRERSPPVRLQSCDSASRQGLSSSSRIPIRPSVPRRSPLPMDAVGGGWRTDAYIGKTAISAENRTSSKGPSPRALGGALGEADESEASIGPLQRGLVPATLVQHAVGLRKLTSVNRRASTDLRGGAAPQHASGQGRRDWPGYHALRTSGRKLLRDGPV